MRAMILTGIHDLKVEKEPLKLSEIPIPQVEENEILVKVSACGVCHTELDEIEGRTPPKTYPMVLGHQIVGYVAERGRNSRRFREGERVGVGWIGYACGRCSYCSAGNENLCDHFMATGRDIYGGYAEYMRIKEDFAFPIPEKFEDKEAAPLLCAGSIGYRSLRLTNARDGDTIGLIGFGASNHLVIQMVKHLYPRSEVYVFARSEEERVLAKNLGASWAGDIDSTPPKMLDAAIDTTPVWRPVLYGLRNLKKGGRLVINAIRKEESDKEELLKLNYEEHIWLEKEIKSVANVSRQDIGEFLELAERIEIRPVVQEYSLEEANRALSDLKERRIKGAKVLIIG